MTETEIPQLHLSRDHIMAMTLVLRPYLPGQVSHRGTRARRSAATRVTRKACTVLLPPIIR